MDKFFAVSLRSQRLKRFAGICFVLTAFVGFSTPAYGEASYFAELTATLTSPPAITNLYGFASFVGTKDEFEFKSGNADAVGGAAVSLAPLGLSSTAFATGFADGVPLVPAFAVSYGRTEQHFNMLNISGVTSTPQNVTIDLMLNVTYSYGVKAALPNWDRARAGIRVYVNDNLFVDRFLDTPPDMTLGPITITENIPITLLFNTDSATPTYLYTIAYGSAASSRPPDPLPDELPPPPNPVPEPTSLVLLSIGALSLLGYGRRHRKQLNETPTSQW